MRALFISIALISWEAFAETVWIDDNTNIINRPTMLGPTSNPTDEQLASQGIRQVEGPDGVDQRFWVWAVDGFVSMPTNEIEAILAADAAAAEQAEAARIGALAQKYGGAVAALRTYLVAVGWDIPCDSTAVTANLITRALAGALTAEQKEAKGNIADLYMLLTAQGVSNPDIAAIWATVNQ